MALSLDFHREALTSLPLETTSMTQLTSLRATFNNITTLPPQFNLLTNLSQVALYANAFTEFPKPLLSLPSIVRLDFSRNELTTLPSLTSLTSLQVIALNSNKLSAAALDKSEIHRLPRLEEVYLVSNPLHVFPNSLLQSTSIKDLAIMSNRLTSLPHGLPVNLRSMSARGNNLVHLPTDMHRLVNMVHMSFSSNHELDFPPGFVPAVPPPSSPSSPGNPVPAPKLTSLDFRDCAVTWIPSNLGLVFTRLTHLQLNRNKLVDIPDSLGNLPHLKLIDLTENQLTSIPSSLGACTSLSRLLLSSNRLSNMPATVIALPFLQTLELDNNNLTALPSTMFGAKELTTIALANNPLASAEADQPVVVMPAPFPSLVELAASVIGLTPIEWVTGDLPSELESLLLYPPHTCCCCGTGQWLPLTTVVNFRRGLIHTSKLGETVGIPQEWSLCAPCFKSDRDVWVSGKSRSNLSHTHYHLIPLITSQFRSAAIAPDRIRCSSYTPDSASLPASPAPAPSPGSSVLALGASISASAEDIEMNAAILASLASSPDTPPPPPTAL